MSRYSTPAALRTAVETRLKHAATDAGRPVNELRRHYLTHRFLARIYAQPDPDWILLGGTALLARIPGARHSKDVDFINRADLGSAATDLATLIAIPPAPDPFAFDIPPALMVLDGNHLTLKVTARLGASAIDTFTVDITHRPTVDTLDIVHPSPVIVIDDVDELPPFLALPLPHQVAHKLCAGDETHGPAAIPSSRYRDLIDLMLITLHCTDLDAAATTAALIDEQHRRALTLPTDLPLPSPRWDAGYRVLATRTLPPHLHRVQTALTRLHAFAGPVLSGTATGTWQPAHGTWGPSDA
ncbi:nucleotidyl transferase AbiEii/AbiGii toxin family protein [Mycobacterium hubeiense]|uniref:nucleotidyl transferase AbiEii/AbiGii toxin family protein n=1 Tax=Mycobacterium hubeiense TaxID=1867256 RepID=UPI0013041D0D|nr:nucleotidyl transferase AbiEii/AbiGii toxin family protein [Mycobacterium sp. QGD 101]